MAELRATVTRDHFGATLHAAAGLSGQLMFCSQWLLVLVFSPIGYTYFSSGAMSLNISAVFIDVEPFKNQT